MTLSFQWRALLKKLSEFGQSGVKMDDFLDLMGDNDVGSWNGAKVALDQMFFTQPADKKLWEEHPLDRDRIRITETGLELLRDG